MEEEILRYFSITLFRKKELVLLCMSMMTSADREASSVIDFLLPLHGIVYVVVAGSRADRVRSHNPEAVCTQLDYPSVNAHAIPHASH